ncbi:YceI family protein [Penaeicola halotolerans]|uniref:YceI family protein n=1 Tax=Penaeicola halotolerans TaxID=2793196 RepID=UPI001CF8127E|nr:YceI family protein [Penaeicola halotolerans]
MKLLKLSGLFLSAALIVASCGPKTDSAVEATDAKEVSATDNATELAIDTEASQVTWVGYKPSGQHNGTIPVVSGNIKVNEGTVVGGQFTFDLTNLQILDLEAGSEMHGKLFGHLQSADFFDTANFPEASFEVTGAEAYTSGVVTDAEQFESDNTPKSNSEIMVANPTHLISGNLTMRGVTKNITFPARVEVSEAGVSAEARFNINRIDWGVSYGDEATVADKAKDAFVYNTVNVGFSVKANQ